MFLVKIGNSGSYLLLTDIGILQKAIELYKKKHLKQAVERNAAIIDIGDALDLMGGKFDPRSYKGSVRSEHMVPKLL